MKKAILTLFSALTFVACQNNQQTNIQDDMNNTTINSEPLTARQKGLAACACVMAQGDLEKLEPEVRSALDNGVTINELKEAFSQLYAYTGFPRSLNALGVLNKVISQNSGHEMAGRQAMETSCRMGRCPQSLRKRQSGADQTFGQGVQLRLLSAR